MQFGLWRRPRVVAGRIYVVPGLGTLRVTAVEKVDLARITPWEAEASGAKDVAKLREWLKEEKPDADVEEGMCYRVRFRFLGPETKGRKDRPEQATGEDPDDDDEGKTETEAEAKVKVEDEEAAAEQGPEEAEGIRSAPPPVSKIQSKPIPVDLMEWVQKAPWHLEYLRALSPGVWRNADEMSDELGADSATIRRRLGDLRKRGLVTSHRHHGYRITPEGQGALALMVEEGPSTGESVAGWLGARKDRSDVTEVLRDGNWRNADEVARALGLSVVSVQRRVAALRDRGLVESHRRRGYRLTEKGREAIGVEPSTGKEPEEAPRSAVTAPVAGAAPAVPATPEAAPAREPEGGSTTPAPVPAPPAGPTEAPVPGSLLEWLEAKPYRKTLLLTMRPGKFVSSGELSQALSTSVTALHGRLKTFKERDLVDALPRLGYTLTPLGTKAATVLRALATKGKNEPDGADAFLRAEPVGWTPGAEVGAPQEAPAPRAARLAGVTRLTTTGECGFCRATPTLPPKQGWVRMLQTHLEAAPDTSTKSEPIPCSRGVFEDGSWFLTVERDPLAEGHCKLICKEHVLDLLELAEWAGRDTKMAAVRDAMARDLLLATEVVAAHDPRIVDVVVLTGMEHGVHMHFDLVPRYRMDLPGIRPLASVRSHYDDLSLVRKRRLWEQRREHLQEIAGRLREEAGRLIREKGLMGVIVSER